MKTLQAGSKSLRRMDRGATAIEFAVVGAVFMTVLLGVLEMGRILFVWNTAASGTQQAARMAAVCDMNDADIRARVVQFLPHLTAANVTLTYNPPGCSINTCETLTVSIASTTPLPTFIPFVPDVWITPSFATTITRESMQSAWPGASGGVNPVCQ